jgi:hypothetical protein
MILTWPEEWYRFIGGSFSLKTFSLSSRAVFTPRRNTSLMYQVWQADFQSRVEEDWQGRDAFFARLDGEDGLIRIGDPLRWAPKLNRESTPTSEPWSDDTLWTDGTGWLSDLIPPTAMVAATASRGASFIHIKGLPESLANALAPGDLFELRPNGVPTETANLYQVVVGGATDENGEIGIEIRPRLRQGFAVNDMVVFESPTTVMRLTDADQGTMERMLEGFARFGFSAVEHLP